MTSLKIMTLCEIAKKPQLLVNVRLLTLGIFIIEERIFIIPAGPQKGDSGYNKDSFTQLNSEISSKGRENGLNEREISRTRTHTDRDGDVIC